MTQILRTTVDMRRLSRTWKAAGQIIGVVPTMGALHDGHLSLVRVAKAECDRVIVTIFVNPRQFNNPADLLKYPRTEGADAALLASVGVDAIFAPLPDEVYPPGFVTTVSVAGVAGPLEGALRPGHFDGVATVVTKLFGMTLADRGYFGQKDWQQLRVVNRLVRDLNLAVWIVGCETVREADGLAMSSRNARLTPPQRAVAPRLYAAMTTAAVAIRAGQPVAPALQTCEAAVLDAGFARVEYIDLRDAASLDAVTTLYRPLRLLAAAWIGDVRLIDNIPV
ncbi:MAG: pantoate--beta-alanine ligase [Candidatus Saccharibacteria bacterium]|nr:pantoate--beta-alanine ligase [Pseudorhodobacter sp.]